MEAMGCEHGRRVGQPCPHCLGIGSASLKPPEMVVAGAIAYEPHTLTIDKLEELANKVKRQNMVYVIAVDNIPDDAYGILYVRKEDAKMWHELGKRLDPSGPGVRMADEKEL